MYDPFAGSGISTSNYNISSSGAHEEERGSSCAPVLIMIVAACLY